MTPPTVRQLQVLGVIAANLRTRGFPPTIAELCAALKVRSTNGVADHLRALQRKGLIERERKFSPRALVITAAGWRELGGERS